MEHATYEPFGEPMRQRESARAVAATAKPMANRIGWMAFWALAVVIVAARAEYFEPGVFDSFKQVVALLH
jgi:hypothetical protein